MASFFDYLINPLGAAAGEVAVTSQATDMQAINRYITTTELRTAKAEKLHDDWVKWYDGISFYDKAMDQSVYDEARNKRHNFQLANAITEKQAQAVKDVAAKGLTTEEMRGQTRRSGVEGWFPTGPLIPEKYKVGAAIGAGVTAVIAAIIGLFALKNKFLK